MKITIEVYEPRFKVGDLINYKHEWTIYAKITGVTPVRGSWQYYKGKIETTVDMGFYSYECLEGCKDEKGGIIPEGTVLTEIITILDKWVQ